MRTAILLGLFMVNMAYALARAAQSVASGAVVMSNWATRTATRVCE